MKRCSSAVWRFFDKIVDDTDKKRCVAVVCKLCDSQYKFFGNTTNLRVHLINKHPIQWELGQNAALDESNIKLDDEDSNISTATRSTPKRRNKKRGRNKNVDVLDESDTDAEDTEATINLVRQMHAGINSDEEWLEEDPYQITQIETYEPKKKKMKYRKIKREVVSPTGLPGFYVAPKAEKKIVYEEPYKKDEYSVFGEYVANKLRKFNSPRTRGNLQQLITTILWQAEYGLYDSAETVKRVLLYSIQSPDTQATGGDSMLDVQTEDVLEHRETPDQSVEEEILND